MPSELREKWRVQKGNLEKSGIKMTDIADKANLGPAFDKLDKAEAALEKTDSHDEKKHAKAKAEVDKAVDECIKAAHQYQQTLQLLAKNKDDYWKAASPRARQILGEVVNWLGRTINELVQHRSAVR